MLSLAFGILTHLSFAEADEYQVYLTMRELEGDWQSLVPPEELTPVQRFAESSARNIVAGSRSMTRLELMRELESPPLHEKHKALASLHYPQGVAVLTDPQFQVLIRAAKTELKEEIDLLSAPSVMTRSGEAGLVSVGALRWAVIPTLRGEDRLIDLEIFLPADGAPLFFDGGKGMPSVRITVTDGHTVMCWRQGYEGKRLTFIKAQIMNSAGSSSEGPLIDPTPSTLAHRILSGETAATIAEYYGIREEELREANPKQRSLPEGKDIRIPVAPIDFRNLVLSSPRRKAAGKIFKLPFRKESE
ncbi:MAG: LysM domain-containing protein [Verrucomicrobiota bacterium]